MNATRDEQPNGPVGPGLRHNAGDEASAPSLTRNKADGLTPGEILREGRLAHDYSIEDLCAQTKLSPKMVKALEDNDFQTLSQPVFARGYYRQCAKVLDLDGDRLMAAYTAIAGETPSPKIARNTPGAGAISGNVAPKRGFRLRGLLLWLVVVIGVIIAAVFWLPSGGVPGMIAGHNGSQNDSGSTTVEINHSDHENAADDNRHSDGNGSVSGQPADDDHAAGDHAGDPSDGAGNPDDQPNATTGTGAQQGGHNVNRMLGINPPGHADDRQFGNDQAGNDQAPVNQVPKSDQAAGPANQLVLTFNKSSWVQVTDASGDRMASGTFKAGDRKKLEGKPPYQVILGFAPGVKATLGGRPVDITGRSHGKSVARLTVPSPGDDHGNH